MNINAARTARLHPQAKLASLALAGILLHCPSVSAQGLTKISALEDQAPVHQKVPHPVVYEPADLDDMIGQMIMVGFHGRAPKTKTVAQIADLIKRGTIGGVILMSRNVKNKKQLRNLTAFFREVRPGQPPFIAIDQEGGAVQRLTKRRGFRYTPGAAYIVRKKSITEAREIYGNLAKELADAGINMNFGPVLDLATNKRNPIISRRGRSYGKDPDKVVEFASAFIDAHREHGVLSVAKHFPGHGSSWTDSHRRFVDLSKTWKPIELEPYRRLSGDSAPDLVMVGHLFHPKFGGEKKLPASLSSQAIEDELRTTLKFSGLVVTDDLEMKSVKRRYKRADLTVQAVNAGNDIILFSDATKKNHTPELVHKYIKDAVMSGEISRARIEQSYRRIIKIKKELMQASKEAANEVVEIDKAASSEK